MGIISTILNSKNRAMLRLLLKQFFEQEQYWLKRGRLRDAYCQFWALAFSKEDGIGLLDRVMVRYPRLIRFLSLEGLLFGAPPYPGRIEVEPTTKCSLRCLKCEHTYWDERQEHMSLEKFKNLIDQFPRLRAISVSGISHGFENPDYLDMLRYVKSRQVFVQFFDTFLLINEKIALELIKVGVNKIWFSIDGATKDTYERLQVGSNFERVISNAKTLIRLKKEYNSPYPMLCFHFIVNRLNNHEMPQFLDLVRSITQGQQIVDWVQFTSTHPFKENEYLHQRLFPRELIEATKEKARELGGIKLEMFNITDNPAELTHPPIQCCTAWTVPFFTVDGTYYPCCTLTEGNQRHLLRQLIRWNVFARPFKEIWRSGEFRDFWYGMMVEKRVPEICYKFRDCTIFETGMGHLTRRQGNTCEAPVPLVAKEAAE